MVAVAAVVACVGGLGAGVRSTRGGQAAVDEPEYLLTALSLYEDRDLSIGDELSAGRQRPFHQAPLPVQTSELPGGRRLSPHDPLLPALLALPMGLGGWVAAKLTMAALAGALAALVLWTAVRRLGVPAGVAAAGTLLLCLSPPIAVYATQVYPEVPAALATTAAAAALLGPLRRRGITVLIASVVALPWLSIKYAPVAATLAVVALLALRRRGDTRAAAAVAATLAAAGVAYAVTHRLVYGGWTVYATGDHFETTGELAVVGTSPDYLGRGSRLVALLTDQDFGLLPWAPVWLLLPLAVGAWLVRRPERAALLAPLVAGLLTATFLALTMHGFWWPGRQLVVVLPLAGLALIRWCAYAGRRLVVGAVLGAAGALAYAGLLLDGWGKGLTWVAGMETATGHAVVRAILPDYRDPGVGTWVVHAAWVIVLCALCWAGRRDALGWAGRQEGRGWVGRRDALGRSDATGIAT